MNRCFLPNFTSDLEYGGYSLHSVKKLVAEMAFLLIPLCDRNDSIISDIEASEGYREYLEQHGIPVPSFCSVQDLPAHCTGEPWAWTDRALEFFNAHGIEAIHPDITLVKRLNSRQFCHERGLLTGTGVPGSKWFDSKSELIDFIRNTTTFPLVIKPSFGNSGFGFLKVHSVKDLVETTLKKIDYLCLHGGAIVEPWCNRINDISSSVSIDEDAGIKGLRTYQCLVDENGIFEGVLSGENPIVDRWHKKLDPFVIEKAAEIARTGYFGTVSMDSFVYECNGEERLAPVIEINARHGMSDIAHSLHARYSPGRHSLFCFLRSHAFPLPQTYASLSDFPGYQAFDPDTGKGILLLTPLRVRYHGSSWYQPNRRAVFIAGDSMAEVLEMKRKFSRA